MQQITPLSVLNHGRSSSRLRSLHSGKWYLATETVVMRSEDTEPTRLGLCSRDHVLYLLYTTSFQPQALLGGAVHSKVILFQFFVKTCQAVY